MRLGDRWRPAAVTSSDVRTVSWLLAAVALVRGIDYLTGDDGKIGSGSNAPKSPALVGVEAAFPLWVWGGGILAGALILLVGLAARRHTVVWAGHVMLCAAYGALSVGLLEGYLGQPWFDGIRTATGLLLPAVIHGLLWWRMGPRPIDLTGARRGS